MLWLRYIAILILVAALGSCSSSYKRPYERDSVSVAVENGLVLSRVKFVNTGGGSQTNFLDFYYKGADGLNVTLEMREFFSERTGVPQVKQDLNVTINEASGILEFSGNRLEVYEASDQLVFRILEQK